MTTVTNHEASSTATATTVGFGDTRKLNAARSSEMKNNEINLTTMTEIDAITGRTHQETTNAKTPETDEEMIAITEMKNPNSTPN